MRFAKGRLLILLLTAMPGCSRSDPVWDLEPALLSRIERPRDEFTRRDIPKDNELREPTPTGELAIGADEEQEPVG